MSLWNDNLFLFQLFQKNKRKWKIHSAHFMRFRIMDKDRTEDKDKIMQKTTEEVKTNSTSKHKGKNQK